MKYLGLSVLFFFLSLPASGEVSNRKYNNLVDQYNELNDGYIEIMDKYNDLVNKFNEKHKASVREYNSMYAQMCDMKNSVNKSLFTILDEHYRQLRFGTGVDIELYPEDLDVNSQSLSFTYFIFEKLQTTNEVLKSVVTDPETCNIEGNNSQVLSKNLNIFNKKIEKIQRMLNKMQELNSH
jgi:hypothetical protein